MSSRSCRSRVCGGRMRSVLDGKVAVLACCIGVRPLTFKRQLVACSIGVELKLSTVSAVISCQDYRRD